MPQRRRATSSTGRPAGRGRGARPHGSAARAAAEQTERRRVRTILARLKKHYPDAECSLDFRNAWELLVSVILSAQCTDERVNLVTPHLFARWATPEALAAAPQREIEEVIRSTGFYRAKARHIKGTAKLIVAEHDGRVPKDLEALVALPGVARKTANVVLHVAFENAGGDAGIAVDTHVTRLSNRLGLVQTSDPRKIEERLVELVPRKDRGAITHLFISHGRSVCLGRAAPRCGECVLADKCPSAAVYGP